MKKLWYSTILAGAALFLAVSGSAFAHDDRYDGYREGYGRHHHRHGSYHRSIRRYPDDKYYSHPPAHDRGGYRRHRREAQVIIPVPVLPHHLLFRHWLNR